MGVVKWTDEKVLAEGRKYQSRGDFYRANKGAYGAALRRDLLDQLYPSTLNDWSDDQKVLEEGRKYKTRNEFCVKNGAAYQAARRRALLDMLYPRNKWLNDAAVLAEGCKYRSRREFQKQNGSAYQVALKRGLLDMLYLSTKRDWSDDKTVLVEGDKYRSRTAFSDGSIGAYEAACRRNLLDLIDFPENRSPTDNDAIYIWRAVGQHYNGNPVYKIGVTSARLGTRRIEQVARERGWGFDLICCEPVQCKATDLERKLHILGEDPGYTGFDGATEFRALSDSALYAAITMICGVL